MPYPLVLHPKWEGAVSKQDYDLFEYLVQNSNTMEENKVYFINVRVAENYRGEILAMVLIVNGTTDSFEADQMELLYKEAGVEIAKNIFTIPSLIVEPKTITPWTFIFPATTILHKPKLNEWEIGTSK